ncbi:C-type lectin lectoxin-Phi2-like [Xenopus tropicalis]|uniref:C-type lectin lectoxin-Phi2-like n=1 Tax=Xenopus tropicalis TaxID=8364 RepID=A0A8J1J8B8_XENTR|nr:C-type lectin lectoxin-Phi2-like [Xenopus tropicalis]
MVFYVLFSDSVITSQLKEADRVMFDTLSQVTYLNETLDRVTFDALAQITNLNETLGEYSFNQEARIKSISKDLEQSCRRCPSGWRMVNSFCYYFSTDEQTWEEAKNSCARANALLVIEENAMDMRGLMPFTDWRVHWIGLSRAASGVNKWKWINGVDLTYTYWIQGEPNNAQNKENCVEIRKERWNDNVCNVKNRYVCKISQQYC